jgi:pyruvate/2-oxoacid:ferredoxin oxidoreductase alpha subunit
VVDYVYGLGGRDITVDDFKKIYGGCLILPKRAYGWFYSHIGQREEGGDR